jgi:guanosine-3',5'-bis(diphosphate) 3'-pyrophosphohydrolase
MIRQFEILESVRAYDPNVNEDGLNRAYVFAMKAHGAQTRASGDPYFSHPLEVAGILTEYKVDSATIMTALLHDTIEDTEATLEDIISICGEEVAKLVDGVTKLTRIEFQSDQAKQAENFRKLVLAMSQDIRVLLVKLADRLHNMRTLNFIIQPEKRRRIATETMDIYAPLAERIGMQELKAELEDLAFAELNPEARRSITRRLEFLRERGEDLVEKVIIELKLILSDNGINAKITGREKTPYSIWRKMQKNEVGFEQLSDIMAFRVVVKNLDDCYKALGVAHSTYPVVPTRFKDYISTAKPNGYQSIHTGVFGPERQRIELQIRTTNMHEIAESGVAAHWNYKQSDASKDGKQYRWLRGLLDILEHADGPEDFLENTKLEMFQDQVFCFTPRGDLINLPTGATPVDFAYAVHSEVGDRCVGAKINGRMMPLRSKLRNGDQVEIVTSKAQTPSPTWERFVVSGKARSRIRRFVRIQEREEYEKLGRSILRRAFKDEDYAVSDKGLSGTLKIFQQPSVEDLCAQVGSGHIGGREVLEAVYPGAKKRPVPFDENIVPISSARSGERNNNGESISIRGLIPGMAMHLADCCHPLPGDRIVGIVTSGRGVTIHTIDCEQLKTYHEQPERWMDVSWGDSNNTQKNEVGRIFLSLANVPGALGDLSMVIAKNQGNISNLKITNRAGDFYDLLIDVEVKNVKHLTQIIAALRASSVTHSVDRARG